MKHYGIATKRTILADIDSVPEEIVDQIKSLLLHNNGCFEEQKWGARTWYNRHPHGIPQQDLKQTGANI